MNRTEILALLDAHRDEILRAWWEQYNVNSLTHYVQNVLKIPVLHKPFRRWRDAQPEAEAIKHHNKGRSINTRAQNAPQLVGAERMVKVHIWKPRTTTPAIDIGQPGRWGCRRKTQFKADELAALQAKVVQWITTSAGMPSDPWWRRESIITAD